MRQSNPQSYTPLTQDTLSLSSLKFECHDNTSANKYANLLNEPLPKASTFPLQQNMCTMEEENPNRPHFSPFISRSEYGLYSNNTNMNPEMIYQNQLPTHNIPKTVKIPWRGRVMNPTYHQLRECQGNLDLLEKSIGSREASIAEKNFKLRFT